MTRELDFASVVLDSFSVIIAEYGFRPVERNNGLVQLDSEACSIQVRYDGQRSYEVGVGFSEIENGMIARAVPLNLGEVYREFRVPNADRIDFFQSPDLAAVHKFLSLTAETLRESCSAMLRGDLTAFSSVSDRRSREAAAYTQTMNLKALRPQADQAWSQKRYASFVDILSPYDQVLSEADRKKLNYALKHSAD